ncbi:hypothetical protein [Neisseria sicca]|uniref:hypothetical protein n=1 Tax=Neisseria sicca TaxID=490 RepID=UPI001649FB7B|nr:hypothetical protein [Neisseria sicca]
MGGFIEKSLWDGVKGGGCDIDFEFYEEMGGVGFGVEGEVREVVEGGVGVGGEVG